MRKYVAFACLGVGSITKYNISHCHLFTRLSQYTGYRTRVRPGSVGMAGVGFLVHLRNVQSRWAQRVA